MNQLNPSHLVALLVSLYFLVGCQTTPVLDDTKDITPQLENLGIPYATHYPDGETTYARNPWDLHAHESKLYIGAGNSSNLGPAINAGPVPVIRLNPQQNTYETVYTIDDEQIDLFYTFDGTLYIPGHDATESWDFGNIFFLQETEGREQWIKKRTVPGAIHVYTMHQHADLLIAGGSTVYKNEKNQTTPASTVYLTSDQGETWTTHKLGLQRIHTLMRVGDKLFAVDIPKIKKQRKAWQEHWNNTVPTVFEFLGQDEGFRPREDIRFEQLFPDYRTHHRHFGTGKLVKPVSLGDATVYIGAAPHNDHQYFPLGLYRATLTETHSLKIQPIALPSPPRATQERLVWDLMKQGNTLYALTSYRDHDEWINTVYASTDALQWTALFQFRSPTFARSFEWMPDNEANAQGATEGGWYFGLGCEIADWQNWSDHELHPATGTLLRYRPE